MRHRSLVTPVLGVLLAIFSSLPLLAQSQKQAPSYEQMSDRFFELLQSNKAEQGVDYLMASNPNTLRIEDQVAQLRTQFGSLHGLMGDNVSHTLLVEKKITDRYVYQHYFVAYERQPISVRIIYYKPKDVWECYSLQFDVELQKTIQSAADATIVEEGK